MRMYSFVSTLALALAPGMVLAQTARPVAPADMTPTATAPVPQPDVPPTPEPDSTAVHAPSVQVTAPMSAQISASMSGQLEKFPLRDGDHFHKGDILAAFRCGQQKATLAHAHAEYIKRRGLLDVQNKMKALGQWSVSDLRSAAADERAANADLEMATAVVAQCEIEAPFDGRVSNTMVHNYQYLSAGTPMLEILDDTSLELSMIVSSMELRHLQPGTPFKVHILETDATYPATVSRISGKVDPVSKTIKVYGKLTQPAPDLLPGMTGEAQFGQ